MSTAEKNSGGKSYLVVQSTAVLANYIQSSCHVRVAVCTADHAMDLGLVLAVRLRNCLVPSYEVPWPEADVATRPTKEHGLGMAGYNRTATPVVEASRRIAYPHVPDER